MPTLPEVFEVDLRIHLKEKYTMPMPDEVIYTCEVVVYINDIKREYVFQNGVDAINFAENILRDFTNTMLNIKRDTLKRRKEKPRDKTKMI